ncbi:MAG: DUF4381 domain-containing protein [Sphingobacteriales bacterium]|uniref:hypothetical protein n=1 Tax=Hydrotalea flava TaxID=714549 RepID=UPI00083362F5|nr:hypothetical protein [Hydrotalea flava]RTL47376.1 MAG: DUF4381 domain-containing protein [Sphingobacteriales bacterium]
MRINFSIQQRCAVINRAAMYFLKKCCWLLLYCLPGFVLAQQPAVKLNPDKILIGSQTQLTLQVENVQQNSSGIQHWFNLPDTFAHIQVVNRSAIDTFTVNGNTILTQHITLTSFDSGSWKIPVLTVLFQNKQTFTIKNTPVLTVLPADVSGMKDYNGFTDIIEVPQPAQPFPWWMIVSAVLFILIVALLIKWFRLRKRRKPLPAILPQSKDQVLDAIQQLRKKYPYALGAHQIFFTELIALCRGFSDAQLQQDTHSFTTDEYMVAVKNKIGAEPVQTNFFQLLRLSDAVKFARYIPTEKEVEKALFTATDMVKTVYQYSFQPKK